MGDDCGGSDYKRERESNISNLNREGAGRERGRGYMDMYFELFLVSERFCVVLPPIRIRHSKSWA